MMSITIEYRPTNQSDSRKLRCHINETTKLADLIPEITTFFAIDPSDYFLICDVSNESLDKVIDQDDILLDRCQPESTIYIVKKFAHDVYSGI